MFAIRPRDLTLAGWLLALLSMAVGVVASIPMGSWAPWPSPFPAPCSEGAPRCARPRSAPRRRSTPVRGRDHRRPHRHDRVRPAPVAPRLSAPSSPPRRCLAVDLDRMRATSLPIPHHALSCGPAVLSVSGRYLTCLFAVECRDERQRAHPATWFRRPACRRADRVHPVAVGSHLGASGTSAGS